MADFQQQALALAARQDSPEWLAGVRRRGSEQWREAGWPDRRTELWKYTPLQALQKNNFTQWAHDLPAAKKVSAGEAGGRTGEQTQPALLDIDATFLVFVNGVFDVARSSSLPDGVVRFSEANENQRGIIEQHLGHIMNAERHLFASLSNAWVADGVLVHVAPDRAVEKPVYVVHISTAGENPATANQRLLVVLERNARAEVIEHYLSGDEEQNGFVNSLTEIRVGENAELQHNRINLEEENLIHVGGVHVDLMRDSRFNGFTIAQGSRLKRIDYQVNHRGEGAHLQLNGIYLPRNRQLVDYHTNVEHCVPHCTTNEVFRGIISDSAKAVFNGRILIHPHAQKTLAELSNRNLLTSDRAEVDTKPELEIYADDVKCAHGATITQLDETAMYYLQSRGITRAEAEIMLSFGFINELLREVPEMAIQDYLRPRLSALFNRGI